MNRKYKNLLISLTTLFFLVEFLLDSKTLLHVFFNTLELCINNLLPSIFIFFLITDILNNYNFPYYLSNAFGKIFSKIYNIPKESTYVLFMSLTSGIPSNAKLIKEQLDNKIINEYDATKLLTMTHFSNPLFIIYTVGINFFHDKRIGFIILIAHFITNFITGLLFRKIYQSKNTVHHTIKEPEKFIVLLRNSFINTSKILINVFGIIIFFAIITTTLNKYLEVNSFSRVLVNGLIEITTGLKELSLINISKIKSIMLATFFISFGGFSIHFQTMSILNKYHINYYVYLISRVLHASISAIIAFLIINTYTNNIYH